MSKIITISEDKLRDIIEIESVEIANFLLEEFDGQEFGGYISNLSDSIIKEASQIEDGWISVEDRLPDHGDHVLVWDLSDNVYPFTRGNKGDDGEGRRRYGDVIFFDKKISWNGWSKESQSNWNDFEDYISTNGPRYIWCGHGHCSFGQVTHWMPLPEPPKEVQS
jgi:hypothetical protein